MNTKVTLINDEDIKGKVETRILLTLLRDISTKKGKVLQESVLRTIQYLNELEDRQTGMEYLETMIRYVLSAGRSLEPHHVKQMIAEIEINYPEGSELTMTMAERWIEEGMERGMEKGGAAALAETAIQLLTEKFGKIPQDMKDDISKTDTATLKLILFNIFKYEGIEDVRRYI